MDVIISSGEVDENGISEAFKTLILAQNGQKSSEMLDLLLRYVTLSRGLNDSLDVDQLSHFS